MRPMGTVSELLTIVTERLRAGECDSPAFDACCLLEDIGGVGRGKVSASNHDTLTDERWEQVLSAADRRAAGEPLQYVLGTWDFLDLTLEVGEGVLIPRPETELLCETAAEYLQTISHPRVLDLCAGSGCVGLGIASLCPSATVTAVEKSDKAFYYLQRNIRRYPSLSVTAIQADVLKHTPPYPGTFDAIVSNPPYIPASDLAGLQREVQYEPTMALDGGEDGLVFYRAIVNRWIPMLVSGGILAVEIGIGQSEEVSRLFTEAGLKNVHIRCDFAGIPRVVCGMVE